MFHLKGDSLYKRAVIKLSLSETPEHLYGAIHRSFQHVTTTLPARHLSVGVNPSTTCTTSRPRSRLDQQLSIRTSVSEPTEILKVSISSPDVSPPVSNPRRLLAHSQLPPNSLPDRSPHHSDHTIHAPLQFKMEITAISPVLAILSCLAGAPLGLLLFVLSHTLLSTCFPSVRSLQQQQRQERRNQQNAARNTWARARARVDADADAEDLVLDLEPDTDGDSDVGLREVVTMEEVLEIGIG